jgi:hypothetical protein
MSIRIKRPLTLCPHGHNTDFQFIPRTTIDLAAKYDGGHLFNQFFLTICAAVSRQNGD